MSEKFRERFWASVNKTDGCWEWTGPLDPGGYGRFSRTTFGKKVRTAAHRVAWEYSFGPIPPELLVCHHCDNRRCVRPDHLFLGTQKDNQRDMKHKERQARGERHGRYTKPEKNPKGEKHGRALVTQEQVKEIRDRYRQGNITITQLSGDYSVCRTQIWNIVREKQWRCVNG